MFAAIHSPAALKTTDPKWVVGRIDKEALQHEGKVFARVTQPGSEALKKINEVAYREVAALRRSVTQWSGTRRAEEGRLDR